KFTRTRINVRYESIIGAALVGVVALIFFRHQLPDVLGEPSSLVDRCTEDGYPLSAAIILLAGRWITTFLTVGFSGSAGLFSPTVLMGGLSGVVVVRLLGVTNSNVLVTTSISAALTGMVNVPMSAVIIIVEIFGATYIIPAAIGSMMAFLLAKNWVIYPNIQKYRECAKTF
ncbi:chloride channel protein, partial [Candidatus Poribacteria bacterium]